MAPIPIPRPSAWALRRSQSSTRSQGMCKATRGASPVSQWTRAASSTRSQTFSCLPRDVEDLEHGSPRAEGPARHLDLLGQKPLTSFLLRHVPPKRARQLKEPGVSLFELL